MRDHDSLTIQFPLYKNRKNINLFGAFILTLAIAASLFLPRGWEFIPSALKEDITVAIFVLATLVTLVLSLYTKSITAIALTFIIPLGFIFFGSVLDMYATFAFIGVLVLGRVVGGILLFASYAILALLNAKIGMAADMDTVLHVLSPLTSTAVFMAILIFFVDVHMTEEGYRIWGWLIIFQFLLGEYNLTTWWGPTIIMETAILLVIHSVVAAVFVYLVREYFVAPCVTARQEKIDSERTRKSQGRNYSYD